MSIERNIYPMDLNKFQAEQFIEIGVGMEGKSFLDKAKKAGFVLDQDYDPDDEGSDVWLRGNLDKLRRPMMNLWRETPAPIKQQFYQRYIKSAAIYLLYTLSSATQCANAEELACIKDMANTLALSFVKWFFPTIDPPPVELFLSTMELLDSLFISSREAAPPASEPELMNPDALRVLFDPV